MNNSEVYTCSSRGEKAQITDDLFQLYFAGKVASLANYLTFHITLATYAHMKILFL